MIEWCVIYTEKAIDDLEGLDNSIIIRVEKAIRKVSKNPLPNIEGGYGKPLGNSNKSKLAGLMKIKLKSCGIRIVYQLIRSESIMKIIVISIREDGIVYEEAEKRI